MSVPQPDPSPLAPALVAPFRLRGRAGQVTVAYGPNQDPAYWGFDVIRLPFDPELTRGFPVCLAEIAYAGTGYRAAMGWIQLVTVRDATTQEATTSMDLFPLFGEADSPFAVFGYTPTFLDAPGPNPPRSDETWIAETFLAVTPDAARTRHVAALLGFRWGYELRVARATPLPVALIDAGDWDKHLPLLRAQYPNWAFEAGFHANP